MREGSGGMALTAKEASSNGIEDVYVSELKRQQTPPGRFVLRSLLGLEPLWKVFWLAGMGGGLVLGFFSQTARHSGERPLQIAIGVVGLAFLVWLNVSLWRCARNVTRRTAIVAPLVQAVVLVQALVCVSILGTGLLSVFK